MMPLYWEVVFWTVKWKMFLMETQNNQSECGWEHWRKKEEEYILSRSAYQHTNEERDLEVTVEENTVQVIIQMLFCSLKSECMECVTSGRKMPINAIEMWWSLSGARGESNILVCHAHLYIHFYWSDSLFRTLLRKYGHQIIRDMSQ